MLKRLLTVVAAEEAPHNEGGLEALIFTAEGDMRQALNNAQATQCAAAQFQPLPPFGGAADPAPLHAVPGSAGFGLISQENVFKVCDQPHPLFVKECLQACIAGDFKKGNHVVEQLWSAGYCGLDIVGNFFRIVKFEPMEERLKLEFIKEIGFCHMRVLDGLDSFLQLSGLIAKLCVVAHQPNFNANSAQVRAVTAGGK